jgi:hypothetical protein
VLFDHFRGKQADIDEAEKKLKRRGTLIVVRRLMEQGRSLSFLKRRIIKDAE